jgi:LmbE family N-acetylglucosaminyl deacetylase
MNKIIIITPHPDDETLGCGGTIQRHLKEGDEVHWLIITKMNGHSFSKEQINKRKCELEEVDKAFGFTTTIQLDYHAAELEKANFSELVSNIGEVIKKISPTHVYVPYRYDIHSDHKVVYDATMACTKWFRFPSIKKVLVYETLSETDFIMNPDVNGFRPNIFVNIEEFLEKKIEIMKLYESEIKSHPFPRSEESIRALAILRGSAAGVVAAEAFMLVKERVL